MTEKQEENSMAGKLKPRISTLHCGIIIFGAVIDERLNGEMRITVIATGFDGDNARARVIPEAEKTVNASIPPDPPEEGDQTPRSLFDDEFKTPDGNDKNFDFDNVYFGEDLGDGEFDIPTFIRMRSKKELVKN